MKSLTTNIASLQTQRHLSSTTRSLGKVYERLSSGLRISRASDDAAGLAVASQLNVSTRIFAQGIRNTNDAISMFNIAEGAVSELSNILTRVSELAEQSANGVLSNSQRGALDDEAQALRAEFNRIIDTTQFNGRTLLDGSIGNLSLQAGGERLDVSFANLRTSAINDGTFQAPISFGAGTPYDLVTADLNGDGILDIVSSASGNSIDVSLGNGDGTFQAQTSFGTGTAMYSVETKDINGDGVLDVIASVWGGDAILTFIGNGDGSFQAQVSYFTGNNTIDTTMEDINGDGFLDIVSVTQLGGRLNVLLGNGNGTFKARTSYAIGFSTDMSLVDVNGDGVLDVISALGIDNKVAIALGNSNGTFKASISYAAGVGTRAVTLADFNGDGVLDIATASTNSVNLLLGNSGGTFKAHISYFAYGSGESSITAADVNNDGILDIVAASSSDGVNVLFGNMDGTFMATQALGGGSGGNGLAMADFNNDGLIDIISGAGSGSAFNLFLGNGTISSSLAEFSIRTQAGALTTLDQLAESRANISRTAGELGSSTSRLNVAVSVLLQRQEASAAAASQIENADVAVEAAELTRLNILQQAATAVLGQANQLPALALRLLRS